MVEKKKQYYLKNIQWPDFGKSVKPPCLGEDELCRRIEAVRSRIEKLGLTHLIVYGDREHFANLYYLTGYDPRFEESVLIIKTTGKPLILVGNEGESYIKISPLYNSGKIRKECFQSFSLLSQNRSFSRYLKEIFADEGISKKSNVGCVGWKYFLNFEHPDSSHAIEIPSYITDILRELAGYENVVNTTGMFMDPEDGLRTSCSPFEVAYFEHMSILASEGIKGIIKNLKDKIIDYDLVKYSNYNGEPFGSHLVITVGDRWRLGPASPVGSVINRGDFFAASIMYWGGSVGRTGWIVSSEDELPVEVKGYVKNFTGLYFEVLSKWYSFLKIGIPIKKLVKIIFEGLPYEKFGISLNPGHLIHLDEWVSSPFYSGSESLLRSGMYINVDVIPSSKKYYSTRMEEGIVLANKSLRSEIKNNFPDCFNRCQKRRDFMINTLGMELPDEVLPLSNIPAIISPYLLDSNTVLAIKK